MEEALVDPKLQEHIQITSFLRSGGLKIFLDKLGDVNGCIFAEKDRLLDQGFVTDSNVAKLNSVLGQIKSINAVYAILDEMKETVSPPDEALNESEEVTGN